MRTLNSVAKKMELDKTFLIVEDNPLNMKLFEDILQSVGYKTIGACTGKEALQLALKSPPDLMILDIQLPYMSGVEVAKLFKKHPKLKHIPIVAVTALAMKGDEAIIRQAGCDAYLSKPISIEKLINTVQEHI
jgi:two-component system cell cycle response regulator DivK